MAGNDAIGPQDDAEHEAWVRETVAEMGAESTREHDAEMDRQEALALARHHLTRAGVEITAGDVAMLRDAEVNAYGAGLNGEPFRALSVKLAALLPPDA